MLVCRWFAEFGFVLWGGAFLFISIVGGSDMAQLHLIGNAHLDPVWLWRWQEGFSEILNTFRSALDRMKEFPDFKFTSAAPK